MSSALRIVEVAELDFAYQPRPWPFAIERAADIAQHWRERTAERPEMFDGRVLLLGSREFAWRGDGAKVLRGAYFEVDYSAFLAWRDFGFPDAQVGNCFSMAALRSSDGAFLLGEMGAHTANAGLIYFAAGTPDAHDIFDGRVDLMANIQRELREETGVTPDEVALGAGWTVVDTGHRIACLKTARLAMTASAAKARIEAFLARETQPELARMHIVRTSADIDGARVPPFIVGYLRRELAAA